MIVSKNNMWASHGLDRFCVRPYSKLGPEFQVNLEVELIHPFNHEVKVPIV
jgi:hypothetical protein